MARLLKCFGERKPCLLFQLNACQQAFGALIQGQQIISGGQITRAKIVESCGSRLLDDSVIRAIRKSDPLPVVPDPTIFDRELRFYFKPEN